MRLLPLMIFLAPILIVLAALWGLNEDPVPAVPAPHTQARDLAGAQRMRREILEAQARRERWAVEVLRRAGR